MTTQTPTTEEQTQLDIRSYRGIELGLGEADPVAAIAARLEAAHPGHLVLVQAGRFLHGYDRTAYALATLKGYKLKLLGAADAPHLRVGFPAGNFKRRLWSMVADFGIPYVVALGSQAAGHTIYVSGQPSGNVEVLATVSDAIVAQVIEDLRRRYHHRLREHETQGRDRTEALRSYRAALSHTGSTRQRRVSA